jgi:hypothetical protein
MIYDGPTSCVLPIDIHADGVLGCPSRITYTEQKTGKTDNADFTYDNAGHLIATAFRNGTSSYRWNGDTLEARSNHNPGESVVTYRYVEAASSLELVRDTSEGPVTEFVLHFDDDNLVELEIPRFGSRTALRWEGSRIGRIDMVQGRHTEALRLLYDCR